MTIAYDNVTYAGTPQRWKMNEVLTVATVVGVVGVAASFGLFYLGEVVFHLSKETIQSLMYLKLSVAGHMTVFIARTRGPFWSVRPSNILLSAVLGTQAVATLITVYGIFMPAIGWGWAAFVWGYAAIWFIIGDQVKLLVYRVLRRQQHQTPARPGPEHVGIQAR